MREPIKTSYDRTILTMAAEGAVFREVAAETGKPFRFVYQRANTLGISATLTANMKARQAARREATCPHSHKLFGYQGSRQGAAAIPPARIDRSATDLANALRAARRHADPSVPVPASFIARVFDAGLTLDEIDATYAVPPAVAVAAIRQHLRECCA